MTIDRDELKRLCEAATPGDFLQEARFLAAARTAVPELLEKLEAAENRIEHLRTMLRQHRCKSDSAMTVGECVDTGRCGCGDMAAAAVPREEGETQLPDWQDLRGRAPGATGDLSSEDFVRGLRDGWREEEQTKGASS